VQCSSPPEVWLGAHFPTRLAPAQDKPASPEKKSQVEAGIAGIA